MNTRTEAFSLRNLSAPREISPIRSAEGSAAWTLTGRVTAPRHNQHSATRLTSGKVLLAGGLGANDTTIPTADLYHPITGLWSATGGMKTRRSSHSATLLHTGRVLVAGGLDQQSASVDIHTTAEVYKPSLGTWALTDDMSTPRAWHTATRLLDERVLVAGGFSDVEVLATAELYDSVTTTWSVTGEMAVPRYNHTATLLLPDGLVLVAGGYDGTGTALKTAEVFNPATGLWAATGSMTTARGFHTVARLTNAKLLVAGGVNASQPFQPGFPGLDGAELYDVATGTWAVTGNMTSPRFSHTLTRVSAGKALAAGGENADVSILQSSETYDLSSGDWLVGPEMTTPRATHTATRLFNGNVLVAGGFILGTALVTAELYTA